MRYILRVFKGWLPFAAVLTLVVGLIYIAVQQDLRQGANDPQIQQAEDTASALSSGQSLESLALKPSVEISTSLASFVVIYDASGNPLAGSAMLHGSLPSLSKSILAYVAAHGEDRITWQPEAGVRSAVVIVPVDGNSNEFVMAGRSLREVEVRESQLESNLALGWGISIIAILVLEAIIESLSYFRKS